MESNNTQMRELIGRYGLQLCEVRGQATSTRVFAAFCALLPLAALTIDEHENRVELAFVQDDARRLGLATRLLEAVRADTGLSLDRGTGRCSAAGAVWAASLGFERGPRPGTLNTREAEALGSRLMIGLYGDIDARQLDAATVVAQTPAEAA